jgi:short-subunit dehydrogenase
MSDFLKRYGQWAMVAGAAEGLGSAFCEELARNGLNLIMVDVKEAEMESLSGRLKAKYHIETRTVIQDLSAAGAFETCIEAIKVTGCRLLVYNAAYSRVKPFLSAASDEPDLYVDVNVRTPLKLVYAFAGYLKDEGKPGGILLMSSLAGIWGTRLVSIYSGTKAFNLLLAEALSFELKEYQIDISACCAGATATPGYLGTNPAKSLLGPNIMKPSKVAAIALRKLGEKTVIFPGFGNRLNYFILTRLLPRRISVALVNKVMKKTYR